MSRAARLLWTAVILLVFALALVSVFTFQTRSQRATDQHHFQTTTKQQAAENKARTDFLCHKVNDLSGVIIGLIQEARPGPQRDDAIAKLKAVSCDPTKFHTR